MKRWGEQTIQTLMVNARKHLAARSLNQVSVSFIVEGFGSSSKLWRLLCVSYEVLLKVVANAHAAVALRVSHLDSLDVLKQHVCLFCSGVIAVMVGYGRRSHIIYTHASLPCGNICWTMMDANHDPSLIWHRLSAVVYHNSLFRVLFFVFQSRKWIEGISGKDLKNPLDCSLPI